MLSLHDSYEDGEELEEVGWVVVRVSTLVKASSIHLILVDLSLLDGVFEMGNSLPLIIVDGLIRQVDLLLMKSLG